MSVIALLTYDPLMDVLTYQGEASIHIAAKMGSLDICESLLRKGADINIQDRHNCTALHYAAINNYLYITDMLLYYGADPNKKTYDGTTPLMAAVWAGNAEVTDMLIQAGADINIADENGYTSLLLAAQNGDTLISRLLIDQGANIAEKNGSNYDISSFAARAGDIEYADFIINRTNWKEKRDQSAADPLVVARDNGKNKFYKFWSENNNSKGPGPAFTSLKIAVGLKFCAHDLYTGFDLSFIDPLYKLRLKAAFDFKPWTSRVLVKESDNIYYQYRDKRYVISAGIGKEFILADNIFRGKSSIIIDLNLGYMIAEPYKGTYESYDNRLLFIPRLSYERTFNDISIALAYEYMKTGLYKAGPNWIKISAAYNFRFKKSKSVVKKIIWY